MASAVGVEVETFDAFPHDGMFADLREHLKAFAGVAQMSDGCEMRGAGLAQESACETRGHDVLWCGVVQDAME